MEKYDKILKAKNLRKSYGKNLVLDCINLELHPGTITTMVGPSGSGKSTLIRTLSLLEPPDSGEISLNGTSYQFYNGPKGNLSKNPWPEITVVFQQLFLWPHKTLRENIILPLKKYGVEEACEKTDELIKQLDMSAFVDRYPNEVSIGQRQLAAIARALALKPKFLLLDEITSALDIEYVGIILNRLKMLKDENIGILLVTHIIGFARKSADQVLFIDHGKIVESGGADILSNPSSKRMNQFISLVDSIN